MLHWTKTGEGESLAPAPKRGATRYFLVFDVDSLKTIFRLHSLVIKNVLSA